MSPIDSRRLARAVHLDVERLDREHWRVTGGTDPHLVARTPEGLQCDCTDASMGRRRCKHQLAVRLSLGEPAVLVALREVVPKAERKRKGGRVGVPPVRVVAVEHGELVLENGEVWGRRAQRDPEGHCVGSEWYRVMPPLPHRGADV